MATLRIDCNQTDIDSENNESNSKSFTITDEFTVHRTIPLAIASSTQWLNIPFIDLATVSFVIVDSDQEIGIRMNGTSTALTSATNLVFKGLVTSLEIQNNSGEVANISVEIFG
jgi:hypothetical protein